MNDSVTNSTDLTTSEKLSNHLVRTEAFDLAYRFITETNLNVFLTGKAGTGKTTFLKYLRGNSIKKMAVAAPTGVAAINAGGATLHSLFQLPFAPFIPSNAHSLLSKIRYNREKLNLLRNLELLIIDEASMVASYTVDAIDTILRSIRRKHNLPFGGVQILFIGDLHQLQPVVKRDEWQFLKEYYPSVFFFDSLVLRENVPVMIELKEIFRQKDDIFIELLNEIRHNTLTQENFNLLNSRLKPNFFPDEKEGYITLTTHNQQADNINEIKLKKLKSPLFKYKAGIAGDFPEHFFPAEPELLLKEGAQVMFIKNDTEKKYFNGKTGIITLLSDSLIKVKCKGDSEEITVKKQEWQNVNYSVNPDTREIVEDVLGSFEQYPLRLAWAITIHKSQGLTFDKVIIDAENAFANGQVYVALSRCTSLEGLILTSPVNRQFLGAHENLIYWQEKNQDEKNLPKKFEESRQKYALHELENIFIWKNWFYELREMNALINEFKEELPEECYSWFKELNEKYIAMENIAGKFAAQILNLYRQNAMIEENQALQQRIKDAANYFSKELLLWKEKFHRHSLSIDTKKISRQLDASLNEINFIIHEILHKINHCKNGFLLNAYLSNGKKFPGTIEKISSSYAQNQSKIISSKKSSNAELYKSIAEMRKHIADVTNLPLFRIFSNDAIKNVCETLPANKESLLKVKGFGKAKVKEYGDEIIDLVREYCEENNLIPQEIFIEKRNHKKNENTPVSATIQLTVMLFKQGKNIEEIAKERTLAPSTIESHLGLSIKHGLLMIDELMPLEEVKKIAQYFPENIEENFSLSAIKQALPDVSWGKLRIVLSWLQNEKKDKETPVQ